MKNKNKRSKVFIIILIIITILLVEYLIFENGKIQNKTQIIKEMTQSESEANLQAQINTLNASHNEYATNVENYKKAIATAITSQGISTSYTDAQETVVTNIGKIFEEKTKIDDSVAAIADNITEGKQAYVNGSLVTGTLTPTPVLNEGTCNISFSMVKTASEDDHYVIFYKENHSNCGMGSIEKRSNTGSTSGVWENVHRINASHKYYY